MNSHVYPQNQEIQETPCLEEASKVTGEVGKSLWLQVKSLSPVLGSVSLAVPRRQAVVARRIFPGKDYLKGQLGSTLGFQWFASPRGDRVLLTGVGEDREADASPRIEAAPGSRRAREGDCASRPSGPQPFPSTRGNRSLCSAPPPPPSGSGKELRHNSLVSRGPDGARRSRTPEAGSLRPPRLPRATLTAPTSRRPTSRRRPFWSPPFSSRRPQLLRWPNGLLRPRGRGHRERGRSRHHVSRPGWRLRSGPGPAPGARARTGGAAGSHAHATPAQPGPGLPGARGCLLLDGAMGPFWEREGKTGRLYGFQCQYPRARAATNPLGSKESEEGYCRPAWVRWGIGMLGGPQKEVVENGGSQQRNRGDSVPV